ncbi:hypothetical protein M427DRAFT_278680 [Gonapodya prolifera JEL478]|uniref:Uncharacterized protein n=1 Tax=Gonapodya prolifera (strain JEL478) TaxID=1344416 RepID=A0A139AZ00_GONPJ|nr:hypothetical protein M427DRAFT_278680 [Gonapodya prolifera JEL478]|eukprot:KXS21783.1 hypothetical protein M427DRAFT_278680 [Gonapodya prolifera JEL478]
MVPIGPTCTNVIAASASSGSRYVQTTVFSTLSRYYSATLPSMPITSASLPHTTSVASNTLSATTTPLEPYSTTDSAGIQSTPTTSLTSSFSFSLANTDTQPLTLSSSTDGPVSSPSSVPPVVVMFSSIQQDTTIRAASAAAGAVGGAIITVLVLLGLAAVRRGKMGEESSDDEPKAEGNGNGLALQSLALRKLYRQQSGSTGGGVEKSRASAPHWAFLYMAGAAFAGVERVDLPEPTEKEYNVTTDVRCLQLCPLGLVRSFSTTLVHCPQCRRNHSRRRLHCPHYIIVP